MHEEPAPGRGHVAPIHWRARTSKPCQDGRFDDWLEVPAPPEPDHPTTEAQVFRAHASRDRVRRGHLEDPAFSPESSLHGQEGSGSAHERAVDRALNRERAPTVEKAIPESLMFSKMLFVQMLAEEYPRYPIHVLRPKRVLVDDPDFGVSREGRRHFNRVLKEEKRHRVQKAEFPRASSRPSMLLEGGGTSCRAYRGRFNRA